MKLYEIYMVSLSAYIEVESRLSEVTHARVDDVSFNLASPVDVHLI